MGQSVALVGVADVAEHRLERRAQRMLEQEHEPELSDPAEDPSTPEQTVSENE